MWYEKLFVCPCLDSKGDNCLQSSIGFVVRNRPIMGANGTTPLETLNHLKDNLNNNLQKHMRLFGSKEY